MFCNSFCNRAVGNCLTKACNHRDNGNMWGTEDYRKGANEDNGSHVIELPQENKIKSSLS